MDLFRTEPELQNAVDALLVLSGLSASEVEEITGPVSLSSDFRVRLLMLGYVILKLVKRFSSPSDRAAWLRAPNETFRAPPAEYMGESLDAIMRVMENL